ncbi:MAG: SurA N-terminal domain-containing protein [Akkermansia sp.]
MNFSQTRLVLSLSMASLLLPAVSLCVQPTQAAQVINRIAATVNGRPITSNEVRMRMGPVVRELMMLNPQGGADMASQMLQAKDKVIQDLIERELVLCEFEGKGYQIPEQQIDEELNNRILHRFGGKREEFLKMLRASDMSFSEYKESIRKEISVSALRSQRYERDIPPTPDEMRAEYAKSKSEYRDPTKDKVVFDKIFIPMITDGSAGTAEQQYNAAIELAQSLRAGKLKFAEAAKLYSKDAHAADGGRWPASKREDLAADFASVLFKAQPGAILGPMHDPAGYTIVKLVRVQEAAAPPLTDPKVKVLVDAAARRRKSEQRYREWVDRLREMAIVRIFI